MNLEIDSYAGLVSPLHRWSPRFKLIGLGTLILGFSTVQRLWIVPWMLGVTVILYGLSRLPLVYLSNRLRYPGLFLLGVVIVLPLVSGETLLWQWGFLSVRQEGVLTMLLVASRFLSIMTVGFVLLGTTPFLALVEAMHSLGLPSILADMVLLAYRYLFDISAQLTQLRQAMRLRGFVPSQVLPRRTWAQMAMVAGTLLVRSYEQSERVYKAMRLRGYGTNMRSLDVRRQAHKLDLWGLVGCVAIATCFVIAPWYLG